MRKPVKIPAKSVALAEFVGIMMGDGGVAPYHISITLDAESDRAYAKFVSVLAKKLFGVIPNIYKRKNCRAVALIVPRKNLVEFCQKIGLPQGNKIRQGLDIPQWIKNQKNYSQACLRGLFDTDGCVFTHRYRSKGKIYSYLKISLTSRSPKLIQSIDKMVKAMGVTGRISKRGSEVFVESKEDVKKFMDLIKTHNPKHLNRYQI